MVTPSPERSSASAAGAPSPPGDGGHAWPALLALTQANRDAAAALLFAMKTFGHASQHAMQPDELYSWYADAHDAADVASHAVTAFQQLTASLRPAASVPAQDCACGLWRVPCPSCRRVDPRALLW